MAKKKKNAAKRSQLEADVFTKYLVPNEQDGCNGAEEDLLEDLPNNNPKDPSVSEHEDRSCYLHEGNNDMRPESSPYASPVVYVYFDSDTNPLAIPKSLFCQSLTLTNMYDRRVARNGHEAIDCDVSLEVGHVLIHYLHTGNYHCLKSTKASPQQQADDEFQTAIRVYREAQNFELKPFVELAREEIDRLGKKLSLPRVIGAVEVAWLGDVSDDTWLLNYLTDYMHSFNDNLTGHTARETSLEIGRAGHLTTSSLLLKVMLDDIFRKDPSSSTALFLT